MGRLPSENLTYGTREVNGQIIPVFAGAGMYARDAVGPTYSTNGSTPPASIPLHGADSGTALSGTPALLRNPVVLVAMFVVGVLGLRYIHWRAN